MTAEITQETLRLASEGADELDAFVVQQLETGKVDPTCCLTVAQLELLSARAAAIRSLIAHATEMQAVMKVKARPNKPGDYVVGFKNSPVRRVVHVILVTEGRALVADSDYPVGRTVEEYGAAWYLGPLEMP